MARVTAKAEIARDNRYLNTEVIGDLSDFTINEDTTPVAPGNLDGGTSSASITGPKKARWKRADGYPALVTIDQTNFVRGRVSGLSGSFATDTLTIDIESLLNDLNADVIAPAYFDPGTDLVNRNLGDAFRRYMALVGVPPSKVVVDPEITFKRVVLPGFIGNLWEYLKKMCSAYGLQIYSTGDMIGLTRIGKVVLELIEPASTTVGIETGDRAKMVVIKNHNNRGVVNGIFFKSDEVYSLDAGEVQEVKQQVLGTPNTVNQPVAVTGMDLQMTTGVGQYVVTGQDGYIIAPEWWRANGGKIEVRPSTEAADEIVIVLTAPSDKGRAPYRISEGEDRPALWITGTGVLTDIQDVTLPTGDSTAPQDSVEIVNEFIGSTEQAFDSGLWTAGVYGASGVVLSMTGVPDLALTAKPFRYTTPTNSTPVGVPEAEIPSWFGSLAGSLLMYDDSQYRVLTASYKPGGIDLTMTRHVTFDDFNTEWGDGTTFDQFNTVLGPDLTFNQYATEPLVHPTAPPEIYVIDMPDSVILQNGLGLDPLGTSPLGV